MNFWLAWGFISSADQPTECYFHCNRFIARRIVQVWVCPPRAAFSRPVNTSGFGIFILAYPQLLVRTILAAQLSRQCMWCKISGFTVRAFLSWYFREFGLKQLISKSNISESYDFLLPNHWRHNRPGFPCTLSLRMADSFTMVIKRNFVYQCERL